MSTPPTTLNRTTRLESWATSQADPSRKQLLSHSTLHSLTLGTGSQITHSITDLILALPRLPHSLTIVTCFWAKSDSLTSLIHLLRSLSSRAAKQQTTIRIRISISSLSLLQKLFHTRSSSGHIYPPTTWHRSLHLPFSSCQSPASDLPAIDLAIKSVFFTPFSVMHSKFVLVDRDICLLPSCNVSWEDWFEGCADLRGPVVEAFWEYWEATWGRGDVRFSLRAGTAVPAMEVERERASYGAHLNGQQSGTGTEPRPSERCVLETASQVETPPLGSSTIATTSSLKQSPTHPESFQHHLPHTLFFHQQPANTNTTTDKPNTSTPSSSTSTIPTLLLPHPPHPSLSNSLTQFIPLPLFQAQAPSTPLNDLTLHLLQTAHTTIFMRTPNLTSQPVIDALKAAVERGVDVRVVTNRRLMVLEQVVTAGTVTSWEVGLLRWWYRGVLRRGDKGRARGNRVGGVDVDVEASGVGLGVGKLEVVYYDDVTARQKKKKGQAADELRTREEAEAGRGAGAADTHGNGIDWAVMQAKAHIKALVVDDEVVLLGSGNMDRASWFTSQEVGVAVEDGVIASRVRGVLGRGFEE